MNTSPKRYAYHCTNVDPEIIKREGWKAGEGFTQANMFEDLYAKLLPKVPVFITSEEKGPWDDDAKYIIKLDITGLKLYPDFGSLPDYGAYEDETQSGNIVFYWEDLDDEYLQRNPKLLNFVSKKRDYSFSARSFTGELSLDLLGTACVDGKLLTPDKIISWTTKEGTNMNKVNEMDEYEVVDDNPLKSEYFSKQWMSVHRVKRTAEHLLEVISNLDNAQRGRGWTPELQKEYKQCRDEFLVEMDEAADALK